MTKPLGWTEVKREGARVKYDRDAYASEPKEPTFWFERSFTKAEFALIAAALERSSVQDQLISELAEDFRSREINGYGR